jgi:hypothetical protein
MFMMRSFFIVTESLAAAPACHGRRPDRRAPPGRLTDLNKNILKILGGRVR